MATIRDPESYPENLRFTLEQVTINEIPKVVGSAAYKEHKYPSDVDVYEPVTVNMNKIEAVRFYAGQFKNIMQKIMINDKLFYADFKLGFDPRFDLTIPSDILERRKMALDYLEKGLIDESVYLNLYRADQEKFTEIMRQHRTLRWTPDEVIAGKKVLNGNVFISVEDALQQDTLIKLDVITWVVNRYLSVEIFFNLQYKENGQTYAFHQLPSYVETILRDIEFYSQRKHYNPLKVLKRLWSLSRIKDCSDLINEINPLLKSDAAALNQIISDIEVLDLLLNGQYIQKLNDEVIRKIFLEILGFKKRIANHMPEITYVSKKIDEISTLYNLSNDINGDVTKSLNVIASILKIEIIEKSDAFLKRLHQLNITCKNGAFLNI